MTKWCTFAKNNRLILPVDVKRHQITLKDNLRENNIFLIVKALELQTYFEAVEMYSLKCSFYLQSNDPEYYFIHFKNFNDNFIVN